MLNPEVLAGCRSDKIGLNERIPHWYSADQTGDGAVYLTYGAGYHYRDGSGGDGFGAGNMVGFIDGEGYSKIRHFNELFC